MRTGKIRPPRKPITNRGHDDFEANWERLRSALEDIHEKNSGRLSFEHLYRASYKMVIGKRGEELYNRVLAFEREWFAKTVIPRIRNLISQNLVSATLADHPGVSPYERRQLGEKFLRGIRDAWDDHNLAMNMTADILMYLHHSYVNDSKRPHIWTTTIGLFRDHILRTSLGEMEEMDQDIADGSFLLFDILNAVLLDLVNMEREGDVIDRSLVRNCTNMLEVLCETDDEIEDQKLYLTVFEPRYIDKSRVFYRTECNRLLREADASTWLRHTQRRLAEEQTRCDTTVSPLTASKIAEVVEAELISAHLSDFLAMEGSGLKSMIDNDRFDDLRILYQLIARVDPKKAALKQAVQSRIVELGMDIERVLRNTDFSAPAAKGAEGDDADAMATNAGADAGEKSKAQPMTAAALQTAAAIKWVDDVLALKDKFDNLLHACFSDDQELASGFTQSFADFINLFARSSEYVSLFIDDTMKRGGKDRTEEEVHAVLEKAIILLRYLSDRDMFERYYQRHLGRRLLFEKSAGQDVERLMISRMKVEMGNHFTAKFEGMFRDMDLSGELSENYKRHVQNLGGTDQKSIELSIKLLAVNVWPLGSMGFGSQTDEKGKEEIKCIYPAEVQRLQNSFVKFYNTGRTGRVVTWIGAAGTAEIKCTFPKIPGKESSVLGKERRYELTVSTHGMLILMLFNDLAEDESLSLEEIHALTRIPLDPLRRALAGLYLAPRSRVLLKEPATKQVREGDRFRYNAQFVSKSVKIKAATVNSVSKVEGADERKETEQKNDQTRSHIIDAAIVRIMKQRKELDHTLLVNEVITQLSASFRPEVSMIKKRIEDLISRDYLERVEGGARDNAPPAYRYVA